jgi:hypothetical protein
MDHFRMVATSEPSSVVFLGLGLAALGARCRKS